MTRRCPTSQRHSNKDVLGIGLGIRGPAPIAAQVGPQMKLPDDQQPDDHIRPVDERAVAGIGGIDGLPPQPPM